eukprot:jgi/Astpho2/2544/gw1.00048.256.1_t
MPPRSVIRPKMCASGWAPLTRQRRLHGSMTRLPWPSKAPKPS